MFVSQCVASVFRMRTEAVRRDSPLHAANVSALPDSLDGYRLFLTQDQCAGFAIAPDGELCHLWSIVRGRGDLLVSTGVRYGATHLNCFEGHLSELYSNHGFVVTERFANWTPGGPDVVEMERV